MDFSPKTNKELQTLQTLKIITPTHEKLIKCTYEEFIGILLVLLDDQGLLVDKTYKVYKGRSKNPLTFNRIYSLLRPYILHWEPITGEKEMVFPKQEKEMNYKVLVNISEPIQIQSNNVYQFREGVYKGLRITNSLLTYNIDGIFKLDEEYKVEYKKFPISKNKRRNMKRYTHAVSRKSRKSIITPKFNPHRPIEEQVPFLKISMIERDGKNIMVQEKRVEKIKNRNNRNRGTKGKVGSKGKGLIKPRYVFYQEIEGEEGRKE